jgi:hypothetical protein
MHPVRVAVPRSRIHPIISPLGATGPLPYYFIKL